MRYFLFLVLMFSSFITKAEFVSEDNLIATYRSNESFETVKENVQQAITNKGLIL